MTTPTEQPEALRLAKGLRDGTLLLSERDEAAEWLERLHAEREADREAMRMARKALEVATTPFAKDRQEVLAAIKALEQRVGES